MVASARDYWRWLVVAMVAQPLVGVAAVCGDCCSSMSSSGSTPLEIFAFADDREEGLKFFLRPCVDCGRITGSFCDFCRAKDKLKP